MILPEKLTMTLAMRMIAGVSMARLLTDADTEAMVQRVQPEDRDEVFSLLLFSWIFFLCLLLFGLVVSLFLSYQLLQVNVLLERHKELRRKKSANSFRREGVTQVIQKSNTLDLTRSLTRQRPQALNNSQQQTPNGDLPPIGLIEEKEENSTAL